MRRTYSPMFFRLACPLLVFLALSLKTDHSLRSATLAETQSVSACSDLPTACKAPVKFLGESKAGCACFACEYGRKTQKILCTNKEADKKSFKLLLPKTTRTAIPLLKAVNHDT
jgi:hypothetical protein